MYLMQIKLIHDGKMGLGTRVNEIMFNRAVVRLEQAQV